MCIRDRISPDDALMMLMEGNRRFMAGQPAYPHQEVERRTCLLYTSDAADERSSVDLGGRRIIKKKKND